MFYYFWYFFLFSFLGWCVEVGFHAVKSGRFVNRGFLNGPVCPIYGVGACIVIFLFGDIKNLLILFFACALAATAVELAVGFLMDKIFGNKWWDYSGEKLNLFGYICPKFSVIWGLLCMGAVKSAVPLSMLIKYIDNPGGYTFIVVFSAILILDLVVTVIRVVKFNLHLKKLTEFAQDVSKTIAKGSDFIGERVYKGTALVYDEYEETLAMTAMLGVRIIDAFPTFKSGKYNEQLGVLRGRLEAIRKKRDKNERKNTYGGDIKQK